MDNYADEIEQLYSEYATVETLHKEDDTLSGVVSFEVPNITHEDGKIVDKKKRFRFEYEASGGLEYIQPKPIYVADAASAVDNNEVELNDEGFIVDTNLPQSYIHDDLLYDEKDI